MIFSKGPTGRHTFLPRRALSLAAAALLCIFLLPAVAQADSASTLTIVGTSDVSDSGLMQNLIQPEFEAAYPQFTFKYTGSATGTAIANAKSGAGGPSVLIVHAASLENSFVQGGFSYEPYGRAIFTNDFVLAGPTGDPAGVAANASNDIVGAFADIATAGMAGTAEFVSRGGVSAGTSVQEHAIWALVNALPSPPVGLILCAVSAANGGGDAPIAAGNGVTETVPATACPGGTPPTRLTGTLPAWYDATTFTQGPNVVAANACTSAGYPANGCYVFTDRGTFDYLASGLDASAVPVGGPPPPGGNPSLIPNLKIVTRNNSASAPGGANELTNYFHAYIINPSVAGETVNLTAAQDFVNFLTSPAFQAQLKTYLPAGTSGDSGGAPFVADASPNITEAGIPSTDAAGQSVTVAGSVTNAEPGYPVLANQTVTVDELVAGLPVAVASGPTSTTGTYSISFVPTSSGSYQVSTGQIQQIENSTLSPPFGDLLSPAATAAVPMSVQATVSIAKATPTPGGVTVSGAVAPAAPDANGTVAILARRQGSTAAFNQIGGASLAAGQSAYAISGPLNAGKWQVETKFQDPGQVLAATSSPVNVTVSSATSTVSFKKVTAKNGKVTVTGTVNPGPIASGARVELFALRTVTVKKTTKKGTRVVARTASVSFKQVAKTSLGIGKTKFTIKTNLKRGYRWILQLEYVQKGQTSSFSKLSSIDVH